MKKSKTIISLYFLVVLSSCALVQQIQDSGKKKSTVSSNSVQVDNLKKMAPDSRDWIGKNFSVFQENYGAAKFEYSLSPKMKIAYYNYNSYAVLDGVIQDSKQNPESDLAIVGRFQSFADTDAKIGKNILLNLEQKKFQEMIWNLRITPRH